MNLWPWRQKNPRLITTKVGIDDEGNLFCFALRNCKEEPAPPESMALYLSLLLAERDFECVNEFFPALAGFAENHGEKELPGLKDHYRTICKLQSGKGKATFKEVADLLHRMGLQLKVVPLQPPKSQSE